MKRILLTALLIVTANTVSSLELSIKHNKNLPTPYELMTKGKILEKKNPENVYSFAYWIAWDKTDDIYYCFADQKQSDCYLLEQGTMLPLR